MGKLTKTELAVGDLYYRQGLKPREIAQRLGISINTVYKALSKYRAYSRDNTDSVEKVQESTKIDNANTQQSFGVASINLSFTVSINQQPSIGYLELSNVNEVLNSLMSEIKLIKDNYTQLINIMMDLKKLIANINTSNCSNEHHSEPNDGQRDLNLPSFVKDNVWVDIIRSKEGGRSMLISAKGS